MASYFLKKATSALFLHLIVAGDVALEMMAGAQAIPVQTVHAGDAIGWSSLTPGNRTHFQARALSAVDTVAFPGDRLKAACERDPAMGYALMKQLLELVTERLDAARMQLVDIYGNRSLGASAALPAITSHFTNIFKHLRKIACDRILKWSRRNFLRRKRCIK